MLFLFPASCPGSHGRAQTVSTGYGMMKACQHQAETDNRAESHAYPTLRTSCVISKPGRTRKKGQLHFSCLPTARQQVSNRMPKFRPTVWALIAQAVGIGCPSHGPMTGQGTDGLHVSARFAFAPHVLPARGKAWTKPTPQAVRPRKSDRRWQTQSLRAVGRWHHCGTLSGGSHG